MPNWCGIARPVRDFFGRATTRARAVHVGARGVRQGATHATLTAVNRTPGCRTGGVSSNRNATPQTPATTVLRFVVRCSHPVVAGPPSRSGADE